MAHGMGWMTSFSGGVCPVWQVAPKAIAGLGEFLVERLRRAGPLAALQDAPDFVGLQPDQGLRRAAVGAGCRHRPRPVTPTADAARQPFADALAGTRSGSPRPHTSRAIVYRSPSISVAAMVLTM